MLAQLWPELLEGIGVDQNEWHAYDVYRHNLATLDAAPPGDVTLRLAALLHDVGKPRTAAPRPDGRGNTFYQHEHVGAEMVPADAGAAAAAERDGRDGRAPRAAPHVRRRPGAAGQDAAPLRAAASAPEHLERLFALRWADIGGSGLPKRDDANERFEARVAAVLAERPAFSVRDLALGGRRRDRAVRAQGPGRAGLSRRPAGRGGAAALFEEVTDDPSRNEAGLLVERAERYIDEHFSASG